MAWIKNDQAQHFRMSSFTQFIDEVPDDAKDAHGEPIKYVECKTAFCFAGYANLLRLKDEGISLSNLEDFSREMNKNRKAAEWLGLEEQASQLFFMGNFQGITREEFDDFDYKIRVEVAITVIERLIDTGNVDWDTPLEPYSSL